MRAIFCPWSYSDKPVAIAGDSLPRALMPEDLNLVAKLSKAFGGDQPKSGDH